MTMREKLLGERPKAWLVGLALVGAVFGGVACEGNVEGEGGEGGVEGELDVEGEGEGGEGGEGGDD